MVIDFSEKTERTELFVALAKQAGDIILSLRKQGFSIRYKENLSPVTQADMHANALIEEGLSAAFPHIPVISEENPDKHKQAERTSTFFLVDPLDGTREFVDGLDEFTVNIAYIENKRVREGVVYAPAFDMLFWGDVNCGAYEASKQGGKYVWSSLSESITPRVHQKRTVVLSHFSRARTRKDHPGWLREGDEILRMGSSLKFCWVARGSADLYPRFGKTMEWDTAAGHAVLRGAGGAVLLENHEEMTYGKWNSGLTNSPFCAVSSQTFASFQTTKGEEQDPLLSQEYRH